MGPGPMPQTRGAWADATDEEIAVEDVDGDVVGEINREDWWCGGQNSLLKFWKRRKSMVQKVFGCYLQVVVRRLWIAHRHSWRAKPHRRSAG